MSDPNSTHPDRRTFLQIAGAIVGASVTGASTEASPAVAPQATGTLSAGFAAPPIPEVRIGFVGVGGQGGAHVRNMLRVPGRAHHRGLRHRAEERVKLDAEVGRRGRADGTGRLRARARATSSGCARPRTSISSSTPRRGNGTCRSCVAAMKNGKHAATEVPAAMTLDDCWAARRGARRSTGSTA